MVSEWQKVTFSAALLINPRVRLERGESYPFVDMAAVSPSLRCVSAPADRVFKGGGSRFATGDTLMARITPCLENGKIAQFCGDPGQQAHGSTEFIVIRGREGVSDTTFAYYLTKSEQARGYAISQMTGTSGRQRVPTSALGHLLVPLPPLSEQRAIAHILGTLDDKIALNRRMSETLESMARALFKSWFVDFDPVRAKAEGRDPGLGRSSRRDSTSSIPGVVPQPLADIFPARLVDSELGQIPEGWEVKPIGHVVRIVGGGTPSTKIPEYWNGKHCWTTPKDLSGLSAPVLLVTERRITEEGLAKISSGLLPIDTLLLSSRAPVGYLAIAKVPIAINQGYIAMPPDNQLGSLFLLYWCEVNLDRIKERAGGTTFQEISKKNFRPILMVVPPRDVVAKFNIIIAPVFEKIVRNVRESRTLAALRDTLLPKLISGELRVKDAEKIIGRAV